MNENERRAAQGLGQPAQDYQAALYESYVSTHVAHRKPEFDRRSLNAQARAFNQHFGRFLVESRSARIADLGCGSGGLVRWLTSRGYTNASGVDGSREQVDLAHSCGIKSIEHADVFEYLQRPVQFDLLFARDVIEHFEKQQVFDFLKLCYSRLNAGGTLILQVPNAESPYFGRIRYGDFTHQMAFTRSSITQLFKVAGFASTDVVPWRPAVVGAGSFVRHCLWRMLEPIIALPVLIESGRRRPVVTVNLIAVARKPL